MKAYIHPHVTGNNRNALEALLKDAGCEIVDKLEDAELEAVTAGTSVLAASEDDENPEGHDRPPACIVVLTPALTEADLEPTLTNAVAHGCRIIGIWGADANGDASPLKDYGADTVPWDSGRVRNAICGMPQHQDPSGRSMPSPKGKHGGCK